VDPTNGGGMTARSEMSMSGARDELAGEEAELSNDVSLEQAESLLGLSEVFESGVTEPAKTGLLFVRLLVRAISDLHKEDDFERLLFDNLAGRFRARVVRRERQIAAAKLRAILAVDAKKTTTQKNGSNVVESAEDEGDGVTSYLSLAHDKVALANMRVFSGYVASLLRHSVSSLRRTSYILKLLHLSREWRQYVETQKQEEEEEAEEEELDEEADSQDNLPEGDNYAVGEGVVSKSATSLRARRATRTLVSFSYSLQDHNRTSVRAWWTELEEEICRELKTHLKEADVEEISDAKFKRSNAVTTALEVVEGGVMEPPIVTPTAKLATPLYKYVTSHHDTVSKLLLAENYYGVSNGRDSRGSSRDVLNSGSGSNALISMNELRSTGMTVLQHLAAEQKKSKSAYPAVLLSFLDSFVEADLLPIAQSYANSEMREIQLNPLLFNHSLHTKAKVKPGHSSTTTSSSSQHMLEQHTNSVTFLAQPIILNSATLKCSRASQLLFGYWLELARHREMVATILDRLVRGFVACSKEERDNVTWKSLGSEDKFRGPTVLALSQDSLLAAYRRKLYRGKASLDELMTSKLKSLQKSSNSSSIQHQQQYVATSGVLHELSKDAQEEELIERNMQSVTQMVTQTARRRQSKSSVSSDPHRERSATIASQTSNKAGGAEQLVVWASLFGSIGTTVNYPVTREKTVREFAQLETVASILTGCDWLSFELYKYCDFATGKFMKQEEARAASEQSVESKRTSRRMAEEARQALSHDHSPMMDTCLPVQEGVHVSLWHITASVTKELLRVAENCLAFLKCETQVVCFLHLHQLANIASLKATFVRRDQPSTKVTTPPAMEQQQQQQQRDSSSAGSVNNSGNSGSGSGDTTEAELVISELVQHLKQICGIIKPVLPRELIAVVALPLCTLIPRIVMRCIQHLISPHTGGFTSGGMHHAVASDTSSTRKYQYLIDSAKYLRVAISCQQLVASLLESLQLEPGALRLCSDQLIEEIERLRRYLKLVELPPKELKSYLRDHVTEYSSLEYITLWDCMVARSEEKQPTFEEYMSTLSITSSTHINNTK